MLDDLAPMSPTHTAAPAGTSCDTWARLLASVSAQGGSVSGLLACRRVRDVAGGAVEPDVETALLEGVAAVRARVLPNGMTAWQAGAADLLWEGSASSDRAEALRDRDLLALAAVAVGAGRRAVVLARERAWSRRVGGRPLIEKQATAHRLARAAAGLAMVHASLEHVCREADLGRLDGPAAPALAAAAAEAAAVASAALSQVYGAASTSDDAPAAAVVACQHAVEEIGPAALLWREAARRRPAAGPGLTWAGGPATDDLGVRA